ncbi:MAG: response regulator [Pseudomonadota bacterium]
MSRILILDDDFDLTRSWRRALETAGHEVWTTANSAEAIAQLDAGEFDVLIVDLLISQGAEPDSGVTLLSHLARQERAGRSVPLAIGVSGLRHSSGDDTGARLFRTYGLRHILPKPVDGATLLAKVAEVLGKGRA